MKKRLVQIGKTLVSLLLLAALCGCWNSRELDTLGIVMGVGIDAGEKEEELLFTAQLVKPGEIGSPQSGSGRGGAPYWNLQCAAATVFGAVRGLTAQSDRRLFFPHNEVIVLGREAAEGGVQRYLDFFQRGHETRSGVMLLVAEGQAAALLDVPSELENVPAANLAALSKQYADATAMARSVKLSDFVESLLSGSTAATAPLAEIVRDSQHGRDSVAITGTAVFRGDRMTGTLTPTESRGLLWVLGEVKSGILVVPDPKGDKVSLEILRVKTKVTPRLRDGVPVLRVAVREEGNLAEEMGRTDLTGLDDAAFLEDRAAEAIRQEIAAALHRAQTMGADIFGFGEAVRRKYPDAWDGMKENWDTLFKTLEVEVVIDTNVRLIGRINRPSVPEEG